VIDIIDARCNHEEQDTLFVNVWFIQGRTKYGAHWVVSKTLKHYWKIGNIMFSNSGLPQVQEFFQNLSTVRARSPETVVQPCSRPKKNLSLN